MEQQISKMGSIELIKNIVTIAAASVAAYVGLSGLNAWKKQLKGKSEYELARRLLISIYKVRNAIAQVRTPFKPAGEIYSALKEIGYDMSNFDIRKVDNVMVDTAVYQQRWKYIEEAMVTYDVDCFEAEAIWGIEFNGLIKGFDNCRRDLFIAIRLLLEIQSRDEKNMAIINSNGNDDYDKQLSEEIKKIEGFLKRHLE